MVRANVENYRLNSVDRVAAVLTALQGSKLRSLEETARAAGLSESTTLRYLSSLSMHDLVEREESTGHYRLGLSLYRLGREAVSQRSIDSVARPFLARLREEHQETVNLGARQGDHVILLDVLQSQRSLRKGVTARGGTDAWHSTSLGKAMLAYCSEAEVRALVDPEDFVAYTPNTLITMQALLADLDAVRARGYAIDDEESDEGLRCVGVAVRDHDGRPVYAISISGPKSRMSFARLSELGESLHAIAGNISSALGVTG